MDNIDRFYIECASGAISSLFEIRGNEPAYISDNEDRKYLDPVAFEAHIKTLPGQLWSVEFRNAYDTINGYLKRAEDENIIDALNMAAVSIRALSATYCPDITNELAINQIPKVVQPQTAAISNLPKEFANDAACDLFEALVEVGYLNSEWQPTAGVKKSAKAYIAHTVAELLGINNVWKVFEAFWHLESLKQSYSQITNTDNNPKYSDIDKAIFSVVNKNQRLKETVKGKQILRKYKIQTM